jgi:hypothetical protein
MATHKYFFTLLILGIFAAGMFGCGGSGGGGDVTVIPPTAGSVASLNAASQVCAQCHTEPAILYARSLHNTENAATCARCHSPAPGHPNPTTAVANPDATGVCLQCHVNQGLPHFSAQAVFPATPSTGPDGKPAQFVDAALTTPTSTLFPVTPLSQAGCRACHNPHDTSSRMSIFRDYAQNSGHGDVNGEGWIHYRWKGTNRASCQMCHTTSAFISKITGGPTSLTFATNDDTKQTLYCIGCHVDNTYAVRTTGAVTNDYGDGVLVTFPDIGKSNLCMNCHTGRENGDSIKANPATGSGFSDIGFINSHYLTGGATVYTSSGYEYAGRSYVNPSFYEHDKIGTAAFPATGSGGPCVGCHMQPARHTFKPVTLDKATDTITGIASNICVTCHNVQSGFPLTVASLNTEKDEFEAALQALQTTLATTTKRPVFFGKDNPYFFTAPFVAGGTNTAVRDWRSVGDTDNTGATTGKNNMGAAFNLNLFRHDFGAFAHNRFYVKRLLFDAIDWADNNILDNSVEVTINALPVGVGTADSYTVTAAQKTEAIAYLLGGPGGVRP